MQPAGHLQTIDPHSVDTTEKHTEVAQPAQAALNGERASQIPPGCETFIAKYSSDGKIQLDSARTNSENSGA